jgi:hypothetical protein
MSDPENFDELIRQKLQSRKFDFDESKWDKAQALIEADEKKKKRSWAWIFFFAGLFIVLGTIGMFFHPLGGSPALTENTTRVTTPPSPEQTNSSSENKNTTVTSTAHDHPSASDEPTTRGPVVTLPIPTGTTTKNPSSDHTNEKQGTTTKNTDNTPPFSGNGDQHTSVSTKYTATAPPSPLLTADRPLLTQDLPEEDSSGKTPIPVKDPVVPDPYSKKDAGITDPDSNHLAGSGSRPPVKNDPVPKEKMPAVDTSQTKGPVTKNDKDTDDPPVEDHTFHCFASGGINYFYGFSHSDTFRLGGTVNPYAGLGVTKDLTKKLGLVTGLFYHSLSNVSATTKVAGDTTFSLGYAHNRTDYKARALYYLDLPLWLKLNCGSKNGFLFGPEFSFLITTVSTVKQYIESYGDKTELTESKIYGYMDGFSRFDIGITVGYSRKFSDRLGMNLLLHYGFLDIRKDAYFSSALKEEDISARIFLFYQLFKK